MRPEYVSEYITKEQEAKIISLMPKPIKVKDNDRNCFKRWGSPAPYSSNIVDSKIPDIFKELNLPFEYDSVSINEYFEGQKLDHHIDLPYSGNKIYILSLLSPAYLHFRRRKEEFKILLEPRSLCILKDELRWAWTHCAIADNLRYSVVFRNSKDIIPSSVTNYCAKCDSYHYLGRNYCND